MDFIIEKGKDDQVQVYYPMRQVVFFAKVRDFHYEISESSYIIALKESDKPAGFASLYNACTTLKKVMSISFGNNYSALKRYFKGYSVFVCPGSVENVLLIAPERRLVIRLGGEKPAAIVYPGKEFFAKDCRFEKNCRTFDFGAKETFHEVIRLVKELYIN